MPPVKVATGPVVGVVNADSKLVTPDRSPPVAVVGMSIIEDELDVAFLAMDVSLVLESEAPLDLLVDWMEQPMKLGMVTLTVVQS